MLNKIVLLILALAIAGCAQTDVYGYKDPKFASHRFQSVIVYAPNMSLQEREIVETTAVTDLNSRGVSAIGSMAIVPPTRNLSQEDSAKALIESGYEGVLVFSEAGKSATETYVPPTYHPGSSTSSVNVVGNTAYVNTYTSPGYTTGGYSISKPISAYAAALLYMKSGEMAWQAELSSRGSAFDDYESLAKSAARTAVSELSSVGLLMEQPSPN
jgi:hypothetical protein